MNYPEKGKDSPGRGDYTKRITEWWIPWWGGVRGLVRLGGKWVIRKGWETGPMHALRKNLELIPQSTLIQTSGDI